MRRERKEFWFFVVIIVLLQALISFQGFDFCDEGFSLTFYQQFFNAPEAVEYNFVYWLSGLIGGLWYEINPNGGILWFRVLAILVNTLSLVLGYRILRGFMHPRIALLGLTMALFANDFGFLIFYHNHLTALLVLLGIFLLYQGIYRKNSWLILVSGIVIGVNYVTRLPNVTMTILYTAIPFAFYLKILTKKEVLKMLFKALLGLLIGIGVIILLLTMLDQINIMERAIESIFSLGRTSDSAHGILFLIELTFNNYKNVFAILIVLLILTITISYFKSHKLSRFQNFILNVIGLTAIFIMVYKGKIFFIYALGIFGTTAVVLNKKENNVFRVFASMALLMLVCLPLGSGLGMISSGTMCIWLAIPIALYVLDQYGFVTNKKGFNKILIAMRADTQYLSHLAKYVVLCFLTFKVYKISQRAYFDHGPRWDKTSEINSNLAANIYTTNERAEIINEILTELDNWVKPGDYLFAYDKIPMLHFLTQTKPYLYNPWPWIYNGELFNIKIKKAEEEIDVLPVIIQQKFDTIYELSEPMTDYLDENREDNDRFNSLRTMAFNKFLKRHNYQLVWSNTYFNIYIVGQSKD